jgi:hypothetical protein
MEHVRGENASSPETGTTSADNVPRDGGEETRRPGHDFVYARVVRGPKWDLAGCNQIPTVPEQGLLTNLGSLFVRTAAVRSVGLLGGREVLPTCARTIASASSWLGGTASTSPQSPATTFRGSSDSLTKHQAAVAED